MPTWGEIGQELAQNLQPNGTPDFDSLRQKYLQALSSYTKRSTIIYEASDSLPPGTSPEDISITSSDMVGFMEVVHGLPRDVPLDLILHSQGGTAEAAESIIEYLRGRFPGLRVIVPIAAMSAATIMAMAADELIMGAHSRLGPIDPQLTISTPEGPRTAPAAAIRQQFEKIRTDLASHPEHMAAWLPIIRSMAPALMQICEDAENLSKSIVAKWLARYMFRDEPDSTELASAIANSLSDYSSFMSHSRHLAPEYLKTLGLRITDLESDQRLQDLVLSVHHSVTHTMNHTSVVKLIENNIGQAFVRHVVPFQVRVDRESEKRESEAKESQPNPRPNWQQRRQADRRGRKEE